MLDLTGQADLIFCACVNAALHFVFISLHLKGGCFGVNNSNKATILYV